MKRSISFFCILIFSVMSSLKIYSEDILSCERLLYKLSPPSSDADPLPAGLSLFYFNDDNIVAKTPSSKYAAKYLTAINTPSTSDKVGWCNEVNEEKYGISFLGSSTPKSNAIFQLDALHLQGVRRIRVNWECRTVRSGKSPVDASNRLAFQYRRSKGMNYYSTLPYDYYPDEVDKPTLFEHQFDSYDANANYWYNADTQTFMDDFWLRWFYCSSGKSSGYQHRLSLENLTITEIVNSTVKPGDWNDASVWSMGVPNAHENVIVNHQLTLSGDHVLGELQLSSTGSLAISSGSLVKASRIILHEEPDGISQLSFCDATLEISDRVILRKRIATPGQWYFCAFPFNVPSEGLVGFDQGDESTDSPGNHLYIQYYDAEKRALSGSSSGNWHTISPNETSGAYLFERGKGYMISIDATSDHDVVEFQSEQAPDLSPFSIPVSAHLHQNNPLSSHSGWALLGFPLFASDNAHAIQMDETCFTPFLYRYNESTHNYDVTHVSEPIAYPPFSAYFVKATTSSSLSWIYRNASQIVPEASSFTPIALRFSDVASEQKTDIARLLFKEGASASFSQQEDAYKWYSLDNNMPQLSFITSSVESAFNTLPSDYTGNVLLSYYAPLPGEYRLNISEIPENLRIDIIDHQSNKVIPFDDSHNFQFYTESGHFSDRFSLKIAPSGTSVVPNKKEDTSLSLHLSGNILCIDAPFGGSICVRCVNGMLLHDQPFTSGFSTCDLGNYVGLLIVTVRDASGKEWYYKLLKQ